MQIFKNTEELSALTDNQVIGAEHLTMQNSEIRFGGSGNILFLEEGVTLNGSRLNFACSNSVIYLSSNRSLYKLNLTVYNHCTCFIGKNNYMNGTLNITVSEQTNVFIGDDNLFAFGIWIRTADPHLVYSVASKQRINPSKSVFLGDHIWVGQDVHILKGTQMASGSILGAAAVCSGKKIGSNESWAGNPARLIADGIFWDQSCVHTWTDAETEAHNRFNGDQYIFHYSEKEHLSFDTVNAKLSAMKTAEEQLNYFIKLKQTKTKNRFAVSAHLVQKHKGLFKK